jgi:hypothetical protein
MALGNAGQNPNSRQRDLTAGVIDSACRLGDDVRVGEERIAGAVTARRVGEQVEQAAPGFVWVDVLPNYDWRQVKASDVVITPKEQNMEPITQLNKRRGRRAGNLGAGEADPQADNTELAAEEPTGQLRAPGMERVTNKKLEKQAWKVHGLQEERMTAGAAEKAEREKLTQIMVAENIPVYPLDDEYEAVLKTTNKAYVRKRRKTEPDDE